MHLNDMRYKCVDNGRYHTCHFGIVGDADAADVVVTGCRHFTGTAGSMATVKR